MASADAKMSPLMDSVSRDHVSIQTRDRSSTVRGSKSPKAPRAGKSRKASCRRCPEAEGRQRDI